MRRGLLGIVGAAALVSGGALVLGRAAAPEARASDHDDGENDVKARSLNLTDLHVFREDWQTGDPADAGNMVLIMSTNPRSLPRQQYFFSSRARYQLHVSRGAGTDPAAENDAPRDDVVLRFEFGPPNEQSVQQMTVTALLDGQTLVDTGATTPLASAGTPTINALQLGGATLTVFAGLREDPFFFDVEQFFRIRGGAAGGFLPPDQAEDFAAGYNVNAIVVRAPTSFLAGPSGATVFDVWETISLPDGLATN